MKERDNSKFEIFIPIAAAVLLFLADKLIIGAFVFMVPLVFFSLYFFPGKFLFKKEEDRKNRLWYLLSNFIFSIILNCAIIEFFLFDNAYFETIFLVIAIINITLAVYYYFSGKSREYLLMHLFFLLLFGLF